MTQRTAQEIQDAIDDVRQNMPWSDERDEALDELHREMAALVPDENPHGPLNKYRVSLREVNVYAEDWEDAIRKACASDVTEFVVVQIDAYTCTVCGEFDDNHGFAPCSGGTFKQSRMGPSADE